jgi:hypothetical protein
VNEVLTNTARCRHIRRVYGELAITISNHRQRQCDSAGLVPGVLGLIEGARFSCVHSTQCVPCVYVSGVCTWRKYMVFVHSVSTWCKYMV